MLANEIQIKQQPQAKTNNTVTLESGVTIDTTLLKHSGRLTHVLHNDERTHFCVLKISGVICVGVAHKPIRNSLYNLQGKFEFNPKRQVWNFKFEKIERNVDDLQGIREYLYREAPGVGSPTIQKLIQEFGTNLLEVIELNHTKLTKVPGITEPKAQALHDWYAGQKSNFKIKEKLYDIGLLPSQVAKVIDKYGNYAESQIRKDCFSLTDISGFGFITVSKIADLVGIPKTDTGRIRAALLYAFNQFYDEGHTCFAVSQIVREAGALLSIDQKHIWPQVEFLLESGKVIREGADYQEYCAEQGILI